MGLDLDLAVSHPDGDFQDTYRETFAAAVVVATTALLERGVSLPVERPLPRRFPFRIGLGSYSNAGVALRQLDTFVDHLRRHSTLPNFPSQPDPLSAPLLHILQPLDWVDHLFFGPSNLFVPVDFDEPFRVPFGAETLWIGSACRAHVVLRLVDALANLNDTNVWDYRELFAASAEDFLDHPILTKGFPEYPDLWISRRLFEAFDLSLKYSVCLMVS